ncbi:MAG: hypothetical protein ACLUHE_15775 [Christensenellales bacterium]
MRDGAMLRVGELDWCFGLYDRGEGVVGADEPVCGRFARYAARPDRARRRAGRADARRDPQGEKNG